jgi:branched-chain amino acid transport system permease protein
MNRSGVPFLAALPVTFILAALAGIVLERTLYQRRYRASHLD